MLLICGALIFVIINSRLVDGTKRTSYNDTENQTKRGLQVIEISSRNASEDENVSSPKARIKRLDNENSSSLTSSSSSSTSMPDSQKLIFYPSRTLKPPRTSQKMKAIHYASLPPNHKISSRRMFIPRVPSNHANFSPKPNAFLQPPSSAPSFHNKKPEIYSNHQRVFQNHNYSPQMPANAFKLKGTYRHPRTNGDLSQMFHSNHKTEPSNSVTNFISPYEINQMVSNHDGKMISTLQPQIEHNYFRRKFRQKVASIPNYNMYAKEAANIYGNVLQSAPPSTHQQHHVTERNEQVSQSGNPFSVMLDVYPIAGEENEQSSMQKPFKVRPFMSRFYQDPQYFNTMNFPQVMHRYPPSYFRFQHQPQASNNFGAINSNGMKPSQIVVHLNLYPKNNMPTNKRTSNEETQMVKLKKDLRQKNNLNTKKNQTANGGSPFNINFNVNTNGHPENMQYRVNQSSTEAAQPNYFYDDDDTDDVDDDDFNTADQSLSAAPSIVYRNIHRDRPYHYEFLRNSTTSTNPQFLTSTIKPQLPNINFNQKSKYHVTERSPPLQKPTQKVFGPFY